MKAAATIIIATFLYSAIHSLVATNRVKNLVRDWLGSGADRWYRIAFNLFAGISFLPIIWLLVILPDRTLYTIPLPWVMLAIAGQVLGAVIIVIGILQTGAFTFIGIRQLVSPDHTSFETGMVTNGLYAWVRHPLYTGGLLIIWLSPIMTSNLLTLFTLLTIYLVVGARFEESRLIQSFGDEYLQYRSKVPMLIPHFQKKRK